MCVRLRVYVSMSVYVCWCVSSLIPQDTWAVLTFNIEEIASWVLTKTNVLVGRGKRLYFQHLVQPSVPFSLQNKSSVDLAT